MANLIKFDDLIGIPFERKGRGPKSYDCYGLLMEAYRRSAKAIPEYVSPDCDEAISALIVSELRIWKKLDVPVVGCAGLYRVPGVLHCAFVVRPGKLLHTWEKSGGVITEDIDVWEPRLIGYYDFVG